MYQSNTGVLENSMFREQLNVRRGSDR